MFDVVSSPANTMVMALPTTLAKTALAARAWGRISAADSLADCVADAIQNPRIG